jgi:hypothetical protein
MMVLTEAGCEFRTSGCQWNYYHALREFLYGVVSKVPLAVTPQKRYVIHRSMLILKMAKTSSDIFIIMDLKFVC